MTTFGSAIARLKAVFMHRRHGHEMRTEMEAHIAQAAERYAARGLSPEDAMREARREFGNIGVMREHGRDARGTRWMGVVAGDVQYAIRHFARTPGMTLTIMLILMLGVTVNTATFSFADALVNHPPTGVPDDKSLVTIRGSQTNGDNQYARPFSYMELEEYAKLGQLFERVAGWTTRGVVVDFKEDGEEVKAMSAQFVTPNYFSVSGVRFTGPGFQQSRFEEHSTPELNAIIAQSMAINRFGSVDAALGKTLFVNGYMVSIVGVAPERFTGVTRSGQAASLWLPLSAWRVLEEVEGDPYSDPKAAHFTAVARLQPGVSAEQAAQLGSPVVDRMQSLVKVAENASNTFRAGVVVLPVRGDLGDFESRDQLAPLIAALSAIVLLILLVCTTTVASLLIAASAKRRNEIAVRLALGASRSRIIRQLLTETTLLSLAAASLGLLLFFSVLRIYASQIPDITIAPGAGTIAFTSLVAVAAALLCGLSPALHATRHSLNEVLKDGSAGATSRSRLQRGFVVAQVALAQPLLVCLAVFVSVMMLGAGATIDPEVRSQLIVASLGIESMESPSEKSKLEMVEKRLEALPGVRSVTRYPHQMTLFSLETRSTGTAVNDTLSEVLNQVALVVTPDYFSTMELPIVRGRTFGATDTVGRHTPVVVTSDFAQQLFPGQDPLGRRITRTKGAGDVEIIGVLGGRTGPNTITNMHDVRPSMYAPGPFQSHGTMLIRMDRPAEPFISTVRSLINTAAPSLAIRQLETIEQIDRKERTELLQAMGAAAGAGMIVLLLAAVGLYAVVALTVSQRRREIGIRVTVGARPEQVVRMFLMRGVKLTLIGLAIGLPIGIAGLNVFMRQIPGMPATSYVPIALLISALVLGTTALASWLPARRAANVNPVVALRSM